MRVIEAPAPGERALLRDAGASGTGAPAAVGCPQRKERAS